MSQKIRIVVLLCAVSVLSISCSLKEISRQSKMLDGAGMLKGVVELERSDEKVAYALLLKISDGQYSFIDKLILPQDGHYHFSVLPGTYSIAAFEDGNGDLEYTVGEHVTYTGIESNKPKEIIVAENQTVIVETLTIKGPIEVRPDIEVKRSFSKITQNIGKVTDLSEPMFSRESASMGLWKPFDYVEQYGGGLMMLQEFDADKTPVVFVHGIGGTNLEFQQVLDQLDRDKYQPWVLQYPSGVNLDLVSDYMFDALMEMHNEHRFTELAIIAHSMGGLMTRSYVMKHIEKSLPFKLSLVVTINSPLFGMDSAASGVKNSPIVVQSWVDVATGSDYIKRVHAWRWPKDIPYHVIFSYLPGKEGDGVVPLKGQLSLSLQDEATKIHGFQAQHAGILKDAEFNRRLAQIMASY